MLKLVVQRLVAGVVAVLVLVAGISGLAQPALAAGGSVSGTVTDASNTPQAGVLVQAETSSGTVVGSGTSGADGTFTLPVMDGTYTIVLTPPAGSAYETTTFGSLAISSSQPLRLVLTQGATVTVTGRVGLSEAGTFVPATLFSTVYFVPVNSGVPATSLNTKPDGTFTATVIAGASYSLQAALINAAVGRPIENAFASGVRSFTGGEYLDLEVPMSKVTVSVTDQAGQPVSGAVLETPSLDTQGSTEAMTILDEGRSTFVPTDSTGTAVGWVPTGVSLDGSTLQLASGVVLPESVPAPISADTTLPFTTPSLATVTGRVGFSEDGTFAPARLHTTLDFTSLTAGVPGTSFKTGPDGTFAVTVVAGAPYSLSGDFVYSPLETEESFSVPGSRSFSDGDTLDLEVPMSKVTIVVTNETGQPILNARLQNFRPDTRNSTEPVTVLDSSDSSIGATDPTGMASAWVPTGTSFSGSTVQLPGGISVPATVSATPISADTTLHLTTPPTVTVTGRLGLSEDGTFVPPTLAGGVDFTSLSAGVLNTEQDIRSDGTFSATVIAGANYSVSGSFAYPSQNSGITLYVPGTESFSGGENLDLEIPMSKVTLVIADQAGQPVSGAVLQTPTLDLEGSSGPVTVSTTSLPVGPTDSTGTAVGWLPTGASLGSSTLELAGGLSIPVSIPGSVTADETIAIDYNFQTGGHTVTAAPVVTLSATGGPHVGDTISLSARVGAILAGATPTGSIQFSYSLNGSASQALGSAMPLDGNGDVTYSLPEGLPYSGNGPYGYVFTATFTPTIGSPFTGGTSAPVTVTQGLPSSLTSIAVTPTTPSLVEGGTQQLTATGGYDDGSSADLTGQVSWSSSDPTVAAVDAAGLVTAVGPGTATITASSGSVSGASSVSVASATPDVSWPAPAAITYGQAVTGTQLDATSSIPGTFSYSPAAGTVLPAGNDTLSVTFTPNDAVDYKTVTTSTTLQVDKAKLTVAADAKTKVFGQMNPALTYQLSGLVNGDTGSAVAGTPRVSTTATVAGGVGSYPIAVDTSAMSSANYTIAGQDATLNVTPATLTVAADAKTKVYGQANPALTDTVTGFVNGDTSAVIAGSPTLSTTATTAIGVGSYPIHVDTTGMTSANYTFASSDSALSVTPATLTVAAEAKSKIYGQPNPALTDSVTGFVNGDTASVVTGTPSLSTMATSTTGVGSYPISVVTTSMSAANYVVVGQAGTLSVTPATLTLTADAKAKVYGQQDPPLTYKVLGLVNGDTASVVSGSPTLSTTATAASGVGTYPIHLTVGTAAAANYTVTTSDSALSVTPAVLTVAAEAKVRSYGQTNPPLTSSVTGFVNGDNATVITGTPVLSTTASTASGVGSYPITIDVSGLAAVNYTFIGQNSALSVGAATLTVVATAKSKVYGQPNPSLTYTVVGFTNGDTASVVSGTPTLSTTASATSGVGSYPISVVTSGMSAANYSIVGQAAALGVTPATITVAAQPVSKVYGQANPALTYQVTGLVNGDTAAVISGTPSLTTPATTSSGVGSYPIHLTASGLTAANYTVTTTDSTLTVTPATLTVAADAKTKVYGQANPALTFTVTGLVDGDTTSIVTGTPTLATTATTGSAVGSYPITVNTMAMSARNYVIVAQTGTLSITPATLTIAADAKTAVYGSVLPALTYKITGLVNGNTSAVISGTPTLTTTATATSAHLSDVGTYPITITAGTVHAANYTVVATGATLTITPAPTVLTGLTFLSGSGSLINLSATLTYNRLGVTTGIASQPITFTAAPLLLLTTPATCTATTDTVGKAACSTPLPGGLITGLLGNLLGLFTATYNGNTDFQTSRTNS